MNILSREEGFLLHAAGVILGGKGAVFAGASGAGKSTLYKLFARGGGAALLNDDRVALRKERGVWRVYGTPWHGECPQTSPAGAPLAGLFFLEQAKENRLRRLTPGEACARLLALALTPVWDKAATARVLGSFDAILEAIPSYEFGFLPDASAAELVSDGLAKGSFR